MNRFERHINNLCHRHGIEIEYLPKNKTWTDSSADVDGRIIDVVPIVQPDVDVKYAAALHEIGHILNEAFSLSPSEKKATIRARRKNITTSLVLQYEREAWNTAKKLAKWWTDTMTRVECLSMSNYLVGHELTARKTRKWMKDHEQAKYFNLDLSF